MKKQAIEVTTFKLTRGTTCKAFIKANAAEVDPWLKRQPGFQSRRIAERDDGTIVDMLIWGSAAQGKAAATRLMRELSDSVVHSMIDQRTVLWTVSPIRHQVSH